MIFTKKISTKLQTFINKPLTKVLKLDTILQVAKSDSIVNISKPNKIKI